MSLSRRHKARASGFLRDTRGAAAAEMVLWIAAMTVPILSVVDLGYYAFRRIQVETAAEAGAQAVRRACWPFSAPLTKTGNCSTMSAAVTAAVQGTPLGTDVKVASGYPNEGYYCVKTADKSLVAVGTSGTIGSPPTKPSPFNCVAVSGSSAFPGTYVKVSTTYTFTPIFQGVSIAGLLGSTITSTAWARVN